MPFNRAETIMQAVPVPLKETPPAATPEAREPFHEVYLNAGKVFELIKKHQTPPDPHTYAMWYAYVTGQDPRLTEEIDAALAVSGRLSPFEIEAFYQDILIHTSAETARRNIGQAIEKEIQSALQIIQKGVRNNKDYGESLREAGRDLRPSASNEDVTALVTRLLDANLRMSQATLELNSGLQASQAQIASLNKELEEAQAQCTQDPLTGTANRRAFGKRLEEEMQTAETAGDNLCLAIADIDHFKRVNDTYGHLVGDTVLQMFATIITNNIKGRDMVARLGGEEFAIILPKTDLFAAYNLLVRIKHCFKDTKMPVRGSSEKLSGVTASFGIARFESGMSMEEFIQNADNYLYEAKNSGRDKVKAKGF